jgi:hypothetical protein
VYDKEPPSISFHGAAMFKAAFENFIVPFQSP